MARPRPDPQGLAFLEKIAALVCSEYDFSHSWKQDEDSYLLEVECGPRNLTFYFERRVLDDPGSEEYRVVAEKLLERLLAEFRAIRATTQ